MATATGPETSWLRAAIPLSLASILVACHSNPPPPAETPAKSAPAPSVLVYPPAVRSPQIDDYGGTRVADPYRWLEDLGSTDTRRWVTEQNEMSEPLLEAIPARSWIKDRLTRLWNYERYGIPVTEGGRYFWLRNNGLQNQSVLYVADGLRAQPRVLLDPNALSADATIALAEWTVSPDGRFVAYGLSDGGTDWKVWRIRSVDTGADLSDELRFTKFTSVSWDSDAAGLYYSRYPLRADGNGDDAKQVTIFHHRVGTPQSADAPVYSVTDHPRRNPYGNVTHDGRFLVIDLFDGYAVNAIYFAPITPGKPATAEQVKPLITDWQGLNTLIGSLGPELYFLTTEDAPRGRIIGIDTRHPERSAWRVVVPETTETLDAASFVGGHFFAEYLHDAHSQIKVFDAKGNSLEDVGLPGSGTVDGFAGHENSSETFFSYTDYLTPLTVYRYDVKANTVERFRTPSIAADTSPYVTEQVFFASKDGTRVPMFITHRRDFVTDGSTPLLLYGYGGFNTPMTPTFSPSVLVWLEMGGVYAVANLRGGSEYGEAWHEAGTRQHKQNVFDDFISAARWLIASGYTSSEHLAILGRSNGGLLVGAAMTQEPALFGAALPAVGVLDMLRYQTASANARQWSSDYGLSENPEDFPALYAYSPYHNVHGGTCYPPTLITTADHDDRVVPWHSYKFGAALQSAQGCPNPILVRVETRAGHGAGKPIWMQIEDIADQWAFLVQSLRMPTPAGSPRAPQPVPASAH